MAAGHGYTAGRFAVELDGAFSGFAKSASGGEPFAEVVLADRARPPVDKTLGPVLFTPIVLDVSEAVGPKFLDWVATMVTGQGAAKDGAILFLDYNNHLRQRLDWVDGTIDEVAFAAASADDRSPLRIKVTITPQTTSRQPGSGAMVSVGSLGHAQKQSQLSNFRWTVSGLAPSCTRTREVSAVTVRRGAGGRAEVDNLTFVVPEVDADPFRDWFSQLVARPSDERTGELAFLDAGRTTDRLRIDLAGLGVCKVSSARQEAGASAVAVATVELYCESMTMTVAGSGPAPSGQGDTGEPATPESTSATPTSDRSIDRLATVLADILADRAGPSTSTTADIAERLRRSADEVYADEPAAPAAEQGRAAGRAWASEVARLDELDAVASLADRDDWSTLAVDEDHSLVAFLGRRAILDPALPAPAGLDRDEFIAGLVAGAAEIQREVAPLIKERPPD